MTHIWADLFQKPSAIYTIAPHRPFLRDIATEIFRRYQKTPLDIAQLRIFLPTRRAVRSLTEAFQEVAGIAPGASFLPRIRTLGDIEEDLLEAQILNDLSIDQTDINISPPASSVQRRIVLANFVYQYQRAEEQQTGQTASWITALQSADALGKLLDAFYTEEIPFSKLQEIVPTELASHWQNTLSFLEIITSLWSQWLNSQSLSDPADYLRNGIDILGQKWDERQGGAFPDYPVMIIGSTGSMPAVARLMKIVADSNNGGVVLPGVDTMMDQSSWDNIEEAHAQFGLKQFLERHFPQLDRQKIDHWPIAEKSQTYNEKRAALLSLVLRPANTTDDWHRRLQVAQETHDIRRGINGLSLIEATDEDAEAEAISLLFRETIAMADHTAMLVTPDRQLARRVSERLKRWNITVDDSAGIPLTSSLRGNFLRIIAEWLNAPADPVYLLQLLKHPLCRIGYSYKEISKLATLLDEQLRGRPTYATLQSLTEQLKYTARDFLDPPEKREANPNYEPLRPLLTALESLSQQWAECATNFREALKTHIEIAEKISQDSQESPSLLWQSDDGRAGASLISTLLEESDILPLQIKSEYPNIFFTLAQTTQVRTHQYSHPRLKILGPLEARLIQADRVILGGLTEGVWPGDAVTDPFLSRPMRAKLGLPSPERRIGLAAHDFTQGANAPEVFLTYPKKVNRTQATPSRWVIRLRNILSYCNLLTETDKSLEIRSLGKQLNRITQHINCEAPMPRPPHEVRPKKYSVTKIEKLIRDPFSIYAYYILNLRKLEPVNSELTLALRGQFYHALLAAAVQNWSTIPKGEERDYMLHFAQSLQDRLELPHHIRQFWRADLEKMLEWFIAYQQQNGPEHQFSALETDGQWHLPIEDKYFTLTARADRIDLNNDDMASIIDYKTGTLPTSKQEKLFSPQLLLTAMILEQNGFADFQGKQVSSIKYTKITARSKTRSTTNESQMQGEELKEALAETMPRFTKLLYNYDDPATPYPSQPRPFLIDEYGEYDHLARRDEWGIDVGEGE
ncbi:MAG: double-strand break repair protein AddB [bacterium]